MRTLIYAENEKDAMQYKNYRCLFGAGIALDEKDLESPDYTEIRLVGTYYKNPCWHTFMTRLYQLVATGKAEFTVEEWW